MAMNNPRGIVVEDMERHLINLSRDEQIGWLNRLLSAAPIAGEVVIRDKAGPKLWQGIVFLVCYVIVTTCTFYCGYAKDNIYLQAVGYAWAAGLAVEFVMVIAEKCKFMP